MSHPKSVAIIGAGAAGLSCALALQRHGAQVSVFDKGRAPGGRLATRRIALASGQAQFDHGAQFLTIRDADFSGALAQAKSEGALMRWLGGPVGEEDIWVGAPGMSAVAKALSLELTIQVASRITTIENTGARLRLKREDGMALGPFDAVVIATPAEQAALLLDTKCPELATEAKAASTEPCWAGLFAFDPAMPTDRAWLKLNDHPILETIAWDSNKPGRPRDYSCWVAHARSDWSSRHLELSADQAAAAIEQALMEVLSSSQRPLFRQAHRWRYAKAHTPARSPYGWNPEYGVGVCGDWRLGPRVECAWRSGHALAEAMLA